MRGEYVWIQLILILLLGSPPHARGILAVDEPIRMERGITPACAGNTKDKYSYLLTYRDHPRMRGEYLRIWMNLSVLTGSPPHARGIRCLLTMV